MFGKKILTLILAGMLVFGGPGFVVSAQEVPKVEPQIEEVEELETVTETNEEEPEVPVEVLEETGAEEEPEVVEEAEESVTKEDPEVSTQDGEPTTEILTEEEAVKMIEVENSAKSSTTPATTTPPLELSVETAESKLPESIVTGTSVSYANIVNIADASMINSSGMLLFFNQLFGIESFDLRELLANFGTGTSTCSLESCTDQDVSMNITNNGTASIENNIIIRSVTGGNGGSGSIETGDAYASANILNVANTHVVDANYLLVAFNNIGDFFGDIVFPGNNFFSTFFATSNASTPRHILNDNEAIIENNTLTEAGTGGNFATSTDGGAVVSTGDAHAASGVFNQVNQNIIGADSFLILFRVFGEWDGEVFGAPDNLAWQETADGIMLYNVSNGGGSAPGDLTVSNSSSASITNNVQVFALTGENKVEGDGDVSIETGDAYASANVVNVANTNVIGRNWALLVFNIFGNWKGNVAFGRPDLWIGGAASVDGGEVVNGSEITYTYTVVNNGDSDATEVSLESVFDDRFLFYEGGTGVWDLGTIRAGESKEFTYKAHAKNIPTGELPLTVEATVSARETDEDMEDNTDVITLIALNGISNSRRLANSSGGSSMTHSARLELTKTADTAITTASSSVHYTVTVTNKGGKAYFAKLTDRLTDESGNVINEEVFDLGEILEEEVITIGYDLLLSGSTTPGTYTNTAQVFAVEHWASPEKGRPIESEKATATIEVRGSVLGATFGQCQGEYIQSFLIAGGKNDSAEVSKLQTFLSVTEGFELPVTGYFGPLTVQAVKAFQNKYATEVLEPWGISGGTGRVYLTTRKKINELYCSGKEFPLSEIELAEIASSRSAIREFVSDVR